MSSQTYESMQFRIGKLKGEFLKRATHSEVLCRFGQFKKMPMNKSETIVFRQYIPSGGEHNKRITAGNFQTYAQDRQLAEGVTPTARRLSFFDVSATLKQYGVLFSFTDKTIDLGEDNITDEMKDQVGEEMSAVREMIVYGVARGATNAYYAGGSNRASVAKGITKNILRKVTRQIKDNHGKFIKKALSPALEHNSNPVEPSYVVIASTDLESDIRNLEGFVPEVAYSRKQPIADEEIGSVENFRFLLSPEMRAYPDAGAAIGGTGLGSTSGSNIDVYPVIVLSEDAYGTVALRGKDSIDETFIPAGQKDKNDPLGQRGYIGANFWFTSLILNQGWMALVECGADALAD